MPHRKYTTQFEDIKEMLKSLTAKAIMTPRQNFCTLDPNLEVSVAEKILKDRRFSAAPIGDTQIHRYLRLEILIQNRDVQIECGKLAEEIQYRDQITEDLSIEELINRFASRDGETPLFILRGKSVVGLVTAADLDKIPVKIYFFAFISVLESLLISIIGRDYIN